MANRKISDLTALTAPATGDLLPIVDISEAAAADKNKKITVGELFASIPAGTAAAPSIAFEGDSNTGIYSPGADQIGIATGGTSRLVVDASGQMRLAGAGITFNGDTAAANELDDYEEGTWTPTATPSTSGTITLSSITASYTKIGNTVSMRLETTVSAVSSPLGYIDISLPFTNSGSSSGSVFFYNGDTGAVMSSFIGRVTGSVFRITFGTGQTGNTSAPYARANTEITISAVYRN
jgi:hypothetical protein